MMESEMAKALAGRRTVLSFAAAGMLLCGIGTAAWAAAPWRVAYVMSDYLGDKGFNDSAASGFKRADKLGVRAKLLQASPTDPEQWRQNLEAVSNAGTYKIIFTGPGMHDNLAAVAPQHPQQKYVYFDDQLRLPNVLSIKYAQNEGSFLAGALAAIVATDKADFPRSTGDGKVALVAGQDIPVIEDFIVGFRQGVASVDPNAHVDISFIGNFSDAQKGYDLTKTVLSSGAEIVYNVAGPAGLGILRAADDAGKYAIGVDSDQNDLHPDIVVASMLKQVGHSIYDSIVAARNGTAPFGTLEVYGLKNGGVALVYNEKLVPASVRARIDAVKQKVLSGQIKVAGVTSPQMP
jgi:basic membrane protein A